MGETHYGSCPKCGAQLKATPGSTEPPKLCLSCGSPLATGTAGEARRTPPGGGPAIAVAAIGLTALTMALARGFLGESSEDKALASARSQILKLRDEVDVEKAACAKQAEQLTAKASARKLKEEELRKLRRS